MTATLVLCAGIPRSGSTWLYNATRMILSGPGGPGDDGVYGAWVESYDPADGASYHVVKLHEPDDHLVREAAVVLTSRRDLRDIAASALRRGWLAGESEVPDFLDGVVRKHRIWQRHSACEILYEHMVDDPAGQVRSIGTALGLVIPPPQARQIRAAIDSLRFEGGDGRCYDAENLLHRGHIRDGRIGYYSEVLTPALVEHINHRYGAWLREHGYD